MEKYETAIKCWTINVKISFCKKYGVKKLIIADELLPTKLGLHKFFSNLFRNFFNHEEELKYCPVFLQGLHYGFTN